MRETKTGKAYVMEIDRYAVGVYKTKKLAEKYAELMRKNGEYKTVVIREIPYYYEVGKEEMDKNVK